jgi:peptidoglycan/LPS O-acetylase OafA/YrhL
LRIVCGKGIFVKKGFSLYLDLFRFLAACAVMIYHTGIPQIGGGWMKMPSIGIDAVVAFFVLSGTVIAYTTPDKHTDAVDYFATRLARLWSVLIPALIITIILDKAGSAISPAQYEGWTIWAAWDHPVVRFLSASLFVNELWFYSVAPFSDGPVWSLGFEFWYYAIFGAYVYAPRKYKTIAVAACCLIAGPKILLMSSAWLCGVAFWRYNEYVKPPLKVIAWLLVIGPLLLILVGHGLHIPAALANATEQAVGSTAFENLKYGKEFVWAAIIGIASTCTFIGALTLEGALDRALAPIKSAITFLSSRTLSIYLLHHPLLLFFSALLHSQPIGPQRTIATLLATFGTCVLVGGFIEPRRRQLKPIISNALRSLKGTGEHQTS